MIAVDTNVLIYSHRSETARHADALARLKTIAESDEPWGLPVFCIAEFIRVVTHLRVFTPPSRLEVALDFVDRLLESPSVRLLLPSEDFANTFRRTCESADVRGNLAFDAQVVAVCIEHGARDLVTADRDFARFAAIKPQPI